MKITEGQIRRIIRESLGKRILFEASAKDKIIEFQKIIGIADADADGDWGPTETGKTDKAWHAFLQAKDNSRISAKFREMNLDIEEIGKDWKSYADGTLSKLTPQDRKVLLQGKPKFGYYINANGVLVPNKLEQEAIKMMRSLRKRRFSYVKIAKRIKEHFGTNKETEEPNIKISHTSVYRIINSTRKATTRKGTALM